MDLPPLEAVRCEPSLLTNRTDAHLLKGVTEVSCRVCRDSLRSQVAVSVLGQPSLVFGFLSFPLTQLLGRGNFMTMQVPADA